MPSAADRPTPASMGSLATMIAGGLVSCSIGTDRPVAGGPESATAAATFSPAAEWLCVEEK